MIRLLLVEDDDVDRAVTRRALEASDVSISVREVDTLKAATAALGEETFDCILADLTLPDGDGLSLTAIAPGPAFVALTGLSPESGRRVLKQGAQDYLVKDHIEPYWLGRALEYAIERKRLQLYQRRIEHHDRLASLGQLAASVAHEINNPTAFVAANVENVRRWFDALGSRSPELQQEAGFTELSSALRDSERGLERIGAIVRQLRSFARRPDEVEPVSEVTLSDVAQWAVALTRTHITHSAEFEFHLTQDVRPFAGRPGRLAQVLTNLLLNASQAVAQVDHRIVRLITRQQPDSVVAEVEDSGPGLAPELRPRAVEPFFTTKPAGQGTGLGLALAREITEEHGGTLELLDSELGGLKVRVTLPLETGLVLTERKEPASVGRIGLQRLTILVVDDEPALRRAYSRLLRPHSVVAVDGVEAVEWLQQGDNAQRVDAIICDVMMPQVDGQAVYESAQQLDPSLASKFVFCSGGAFREDMASFLQTIPNPVLLKPTNRDALIEAVGRILIGQEHSVAANA